MEIDTTVENREYTDAEARFSSEIPMLGGIGAQVDKAQQETENREEVIARNKVLAQQGREVTATMEPDEFKFSMERDKAQGKVALNSNWFFNWLDESERDDRFAKADETGDPVQIEDTLAADILNGNQLPEEYLGLIKSSKTSNGLESRIEWAKADAESKGYIAKALSEKEQTMVSIGASLATPDVVLGVGAPALLYKTAKVAQTVAKGSKAAQVASSTPFIAAVEFGVEAGINTFHANVDEKYDMKAAAIDTLIYGSAGTIITRLVTPKAMHEVAGNSEVAKEITIQGAMREKPIEVPREADGKVTPKTDYVAPEKPTDAIGTDRPAETKTLTQEGSVTHPSAVGAKREGEGVEYTKADGSVDEWTEATIDGKPVFVYGNSKGETVYKNTVTGKVIKVVDEPYDYKYIYGESKASNKTYSQADGKIYEITQEVKGAQRKVHETPTLKEAGRVEIETATNKALDEVVNPEQTRAIDNIETKKQELKDFRTETLVEPKAKVAKAEETLAKEKKILEEKKLDPKSTEGQIKYREKKIAKIQKELDAAKAEIKAIDEGHAKTMGEHAETIAEIRRTVDESPKRAEIREMFEHYMIEPRQHLEEIMKFIKTNPDKEYFNALKENLDGLRAKFPVEVKQIEDLIKSKGNNTAALKSEWYKKLSPHNKKILATAGILSAGTASASGGDDDVSNVAILGMVVLGFLGVANRQAIAALFKSGSGVGGMVEGMKNSWAKASTGIVHEEGMPTAGKWRKSAAAIAEKGYTQLFSASAPFIKAQGAAMEYITKMLYNKDFGGGALTMKNEWFKSAMADYMVSEKNNHRLWLEEQGKTEGKILQNENTMEEFRELVLDVKEGLVKSDSKAVNELADLMKDKFEDMLISNKEYKTHGFEKVKFSPDYVPRLWRTAAIQDLLGKMTDTQVKSFSEALAKSIKGENAKQTADALIDGWTNASAKASENAKAEVVGMLSDSNLLKDGEDVEDILDAITGVTDRGARAKYRIDIDMATLKKEVDALAIDGLKFNTILDRSSWSVFDKLGNQMYSSAALSREGITSSIKLEAMIVAVEKQDKVLGHQARQIKSLVMGEPLPVDNEFLHTISSAMKDLTLGGKLPLVALSTPTEIIQTLFSNGFFSGLKNIGRAISVKTVGTDSEMLHQMAKIGSLGRGTDLIDLKYAKRGFSNEFIDSGETAFTQFREGTMKFRDLVIYFSGLSGITDVLQLANKFAHTEQLGRIANGMENGIPLERYTEFGITPERMSALKPYMVFDESGTLQKVDVDAMPRKVRDDYQEMTFNMNQAITPETTVGETPLFTRTSSLGRILTTLVAYPMQQFNLHGIQGVKRMDKYSAIQFMGGIGGTYLGLSARNELLDKKMDDDTILMYSMMNAPQGLGLAAVKSFLDPAVVGHNRELMQMADFSQ